MDKVLIFFPDGSPVEYEVDGYEDDGRKIAFTLASGEKIETNLRYLVGPAAVIDELLVAPASAISADIAEEPH